MKKLFKKLALMIVALLTFSVGNNYTVKEVKAAENEIIFNLGADGEAKHYDGSGNSTYTEEADGYTLSITGGTNMYTGARDLKGNSCIKMGTGSKAGSFTISNVPSDVTSVVIYAAKYKTNNATVTINTEKTTLTKNSNDGAYDALSVDTTTSKSISFAVTSGYRCMVNTITFIKSTGEDTQLPSLSISGDEHTQVGSTISLNVDAENLTEDIIWTSSNEEVATVTGNVVTAKAMGTTTITASADGLEKSITIKVYPKADSELTIADALAVCELTGNTESPFSYSVTGIIETIDTVYNDEYDNITVTITDRNNCIQAYRLSGGSELQVYDKIKITGKLINYQENNSQFIQNSTYVELEVEFSDISTMAQLDFGYDYTESSTSTITATSNKTTGNMVEGNNAASLNLDANEWTVTPNKGGHNNYPGFGSDNTVRIYYNSTASNTLTFEYKESISSITITYASASYSNGVVIVGDSKIPGTSLSDTVYKYNINSKSFSITNGNTSNIQVRFTSIEFTIGVPVTYSDFRNVNIKYSITMPTELFSDIETFGFNIAVGSNSKDFLVSKTSVKGDRTSFALVLSDITDYYSEIKVTGFVMNGETRVEFYQSVFSVKTMIQYYIDHSAKLGLSTQQIEILTAFQADIA